MNNITLFIFKILSIALSEKRIFIANLFRKYKIQFIYDKISTDVSFSAFPKKKTIVIGLFGLKKIWLFGRLFSEIYDEFSKQWEDDPNQATDSLESGIDNSPPIQSLEHFLDNEDNPENNSFLKRYFNRKGNQKTKEWSECSDELALMVLTYILLHEIGHIVLNHNSNPNFLIKQEIEADKWARNLLLDGIPVESNAFLKRALGLMTSYLIILNYEIRKPCTSLLTHPPALLRLFYTIGLNLNNFDNHKSWMFMVVIVLTYFHIIGLPIPRIRPNSPKDWFLEILLYFFNFTTKTITFFDI